MTTYETSDLHKRVGRYETALEELRAAHQDVRNILHDQVLYERWQQLGAELGFVLPVSAPADVPSAGQPVAGLQQIPQMSESWAG